MCSHFELVCFLINASSLTETRCYLSSVNAFHTLLFCDFRELSNFKDLSSVFEFPDSTCIFYENDSILLITINFSE